ncbi:MAG: tetratricopeptide repeat protein [Spirochaetaceae bacterium]|nr:MAG: tetratricopeptide repeat protein [Spirochaetaceae bacterium]
MDVLFYVLIVLAAVGLLIMAAVLVFKRDRGSESRQRSHRRDRNLVLREATRRLAQDPRDVSALKDLAQITFEDQNFSNSYKYFRSLVSLCGANPEIDEFEVNLRLGQSAFKLNKAEEAHKHLMVARTLRPDEFEVNFNLGLLEYVQKNHHKASEYFKIAHSQRSDDVATNRYLGHCLYGLHSFNEAIEVLQRVLDFEPEDKKVQFLLGKSYFALKQNDLALKIFTRLRTDPDIGAIAALHSGTLNTNAKKFDTAIEDFDIGLRHENITQPVFLELKYRLAEANLKAGNLSEAVRLWKEISTLHPNYKNVADKISQYQEVNTNRFLQTFLLGVSSDFVTLCRRIATRYYSNSNTKLINISLRKGEYADILANVRTPQWEDQVLFRFIRSQGAIGELLLRDMYVHAKDIHANRAVCVAAGTFSEQAQEFVEARMIDLVDKDNLIRMLKKL